MTAETRTPTPTLRAALRNWWRTRHRASARPVRPLPLHEALAIGLGCTSPTWSVRPAGGTPATGADAR